MKTTKEEIAKIAERENLNADALYQACDNALGFSVRAVGTNNVPEELAIGATVVAVKHYFKGLEKPEQEKPGLRSAQGWSASYPKGRMP